MYERHFGFTQSPFSISPDPRFLYLSAHHREALAHLLFGMGQGGGFVQLTGEVGTGKTTLCRSILESPPAHVDFAFILNPTVTPFELVNTVCDELGVEVAAGTSSMKTLVDQLNRRLLESHGKGRRTVVIIDEAQNLSSASLEQIRLLTNLETPTQKLLQIVLIGQPELQTLMARPELRQLSQRITARYHLPPLDREESAEYVRHRLRVVGGSPALFSPATLRVAHHLSGGVPRLLNILCDRALLGAYALEKQTVGRALIRKAWREIQGQSRQHPMTTFRPLFWAPLLVIVVLLGGATLVQMPDWLPDHPLFSLSAPNSETTTSTPAPHTPPSVAVSPPPFQSGDGNSSDDVQSVLNAVEVASDAARAYHDLWSLWGRIDFQDGEDICAVASAEGLRCYRDRGTWAQLARYDRPAVLELVLPDGSPHSVLLKAMQNENLVLRIADTEYTIARDHLTPFWFGEFTLVWMPPPGGSLVLREGSRGADVAWLAYRLAAATFDEVASDVSPQHGQDTYDHTLQRQVSAFQQQRGLVPDGVAGRETFMALNSILQSPPVPLLTVDNPL